MSQETWDHLKKIGSEEGKFKVLMVCIGNICRSPMAEAVFMKIAKELGIDDRWEADSAALYSYHTGSNPDDRTMKTLSENGIKDYEHHARPIKKVDYNNFTFIFGMDNEIMNELEVGKPKNCKAKVCHLGEWHPEGDCQIEDPYYEPSRDGFIKNYDQIVECCRAFLECFKKYNKITK